MTQDDEIAKWLRELPLNKITALYLWGLKEPLCLVALKPWLDENPSRKVICIEENHDTFQEFLKTPHAQSLLKNPQIDILTPEGWKEVIDRYVMYPGYLKYHIAKNLLSDPHQFVLFQNTFNCRIENFIIVRSEELSFGGPTTENFYRNILKLPNAYNAMALFGKFSKIPAVIVGAGPSLQSNLSVLEKNRNKALIFSGGTAMNALAGSQVIPHFGLALDPNPYQVSRLVMNQAFEIPEFYSNRLFSEAFDLIQGPKIYLPSFVERSLGFWFEQQLGLNPIAKNAGMSVTTVNLVLAYLLGCDPIILVGVDLAYTKGRSYAPGVISHAFHTMRDNFVTKKAEDTLLKTNDIFGKELLTLWKWYEESVWISNFANEHHDVWVINSTEGGLGFEGIHNIALERVFQTLELNEDLEKLVFEEVFKAKMPEGVTDEKIREILNKLKESLLEVETLVDTPKGLEEIENSFCFDACLKNYINAYSRIFELDAIKNRGEYENALRAHIKKGCVFNRELIEKTLSNPPPDEIPFQPHPKPLQGEKVIYDPNGQIRVRLNEKEGVREGLCLFYTEKGVLSSSLNYKSGRLDGEVCLYNEKGALKRRLHFKEGAWEGKEEWFLEEGKIWLIAEYHNSQPIGEARMWYESGQLKELRVFEMGKLVKTQMFYPNGQEVPVSPKKDFFENLVTSTADFHKTLEGLFAQVEALGGQDQRDALNRLKKLQDDMMRQLKLFEDKEAIWKTETTKELIKEVLDLKTQTMMENIEKSLKELKKKERLEE